MTQLRLPVPAPRELAGTQALYEKMLRAEIDPLAQVFSVYDVRAQSLAASGGATDFGEYFTYFSLFLVFSALLLAALFFKLGVEQRLREIGLLQALGLNPAAVGSLFLGEALVLSLLGGLAGIVGAVAYGAAIMYGLRTWWLGAVGTTALSLHVGPSSLISGALSGVVVAAACIWWTLRSLRGVSARSLLAGDQKMVREPWSSRAGKKDSRSVLARVCAAGGGAHRGRGHATCGPGGRVLWRGRIGPARHAVLGGHLAAARPNWRASGAWLVGSLAPGMAKCHQSSCAQCALHRPDRIGNICHRRGRSLQTR